MAHLWDSSRNLRHHSVIFHGPCRRRSIGPLPSCFMLAGITLLNPYNENHQIIQSCIDVKNKIPPCPCRRFPMSLFHLLRYSRHPSCRSSGVRGPFSKGQRGSLFREAVRERVLLRSEASFFNLEMSFQFSRISEGRKPFLERKTRGFRQGSPIRFPY